MSGRRPIVAVTRRLPERVEARLSELFEARLNPSDTALDAEAVLARCAGAGGLLVAPTERLDADLVGRLPPSLRVIATYSAGTDHIDLRATARRGITVTNTPDVLTEATADIALLCLLGAARRAREAQALLYEGRWTRWTPTALLGAELSGRVIGILGMGRIGTATARRAAAFGMRVAYLAARPRPELPTDWTPVAVPPSRRERLAAALEATLDDPGYAARIAQLSIAPAREEERGPAHLGRLMRDESPRWAQFLREAVIKAE